MHNLEAFNRLQYWEQLETIQYGQILPRLEDYPLRGTLKIEKVKRGYRIDQEVREAATGLPVLMAPHEAWCILRDMPRQIIPFKMLPGNKLKPMRIFIFCPINSNIMILNTYVSIKPEFAHLSTLTG